MLRRSAAAELALSQARKSCKQVTKEAMDLASHSININTRVWPMFEEALEFQPHIEAYEQDVKNAQHSTLSLFDTIMPILSVPLPRVWKLVEGDRGEPIRVTESHGHHNIAGGDCDLASIRASLTHFEKNTQQDICRPLATWLDSLQLARDRFPELQHLYQETVKCARKLLAETGAEKDRKTDLGSLLLRCAGQPAVQEEEPAGSRGLGDQSTRVDQQHKREEHQVAIRDKQRKFEAALDSFNEQEKLMFDHLSGLCRDAAWLKSYMASELMFLKELMQEAAFFLGPTMQPLPIFDTGEKPSERLVAGNVELIVCGRPSYLDQQNGEDWTAESAAHIRRAPRSAKYPLECHTQPRAPATPLSTPTQSLVQKAEPQPPIPADVTWQ